MWFILVFFSCCIQMMISKPCGNSFIDLEPVPHVGPQGRSASLPVQGRQVPKHFGDLYVVLGIFYDPPFERRFKGDQVKMNKFILALVKTVQLVYDQPIWRTAANITFIVSHLQPWDPAIEAPKVKDPALTTELLSNFSFSADQIRERIFGKWQISILLSGLNGYGPKEGRNENESPTSLTGLAHISVLCYAPQSSAGIIEAKNFHSGLVMAHEIGHTMGIRHDSLNNPIDYHNIVNDNRACSSDKFIMSPNVGEDKVTFSSCSVQNFIRFMANISMYEYYSCVKDMKDVVSFKGFEKIRGPPYPGQMFDADAQCQYAYGEVYTTAFEADVSIECYFEIL